MRFKIAEKEGVVILAPEGRMMAGPGLDKMRDKIRELVRIGARRLVIDLGKVPWAGSPGLGLLLETKKLLQDSGGELRLARITEKIEDIIDVTRLTRQFDTSPSVNEAVKECLSV